MSRVEHLADGVTLYLGDCREILPTLGRFDAVVTDPPYELGFMGKSWDASGVAFCPETWRAVFNVMKPGAHLVAFGAPKNYHRLACAIEDAGFEIRDSLMWVFGSGFPKSHDIAKAMDGVLGKQAKGFKFKGGDLPTNGGSKFRSDHPDYVPYAPATDAAREWAGWGTALKPAYEPIVLARKPLSEGTVAANVLRWGTGALNIDATRVSMSDKDAAYIQDRIGGFNNTKSIGGNGAYSGGETMDRAAAYDASKGRWPANLCHDGSQGVLDLFPQTNKSTGRDSRGRVHQAFTDDARRSTRDDVHPGYGDEGSAARFFYCAKASKQDRAGSSHPTVKPINLMRWLVRMVTPPGGTVLDPFGGSGTTAQAAVSEGFNVTLIERESEYCTDIQNRMRAVG